MELLSEPTLEALCQSYGLYAVFAFIALESMGVPLPGETILIVAGIYAGATRRIDIFSVIGIAASAAIIGDNIGYLVGRLVGQASLRKYGRHIGLDERRIKIGQYLFLRQGGKIVFFGRFVAVLRAFAALLAGVNRMAWSRFLLMNALGGVCWATLVGGSAYVFGNRIEHLATPLAITLFLVAVALIVAATFYIANCEVELGNRAERELRDPAGAVDQRRGHAPIIE